MPWGANTYPGTPQFLTIQGAAGDVACTAGSYTTVMSIGGASNVFQHSQVGQWIPIVLAMLYIKLGATAPSALIVGFATTSGTEIDSIAMDTDLLVNNGSFALTFPLMGVKSGTLWQAGATPLVEVNPTGQNVTVRSVGAAGTRGLFWLQPGSN